MSRAGRGHAKHAGALCSWPLVATEMPLVQTQGRPGGLSPLFGLAHLRLCPLWSRRGEAYRPAPLHTHTLPRGPLLPQVEWPLQARRSSGFQNRPRAGHLQAPPTAGWTGHPA